jgi:hypothetical protein
MGKRALVVSLLLLAASYSNAESKVERCENMLTSGIYNELLEDICGFKGGVFSGFQDAYSRNSCPDLISTDKIHELAEDVAKDTIKRHLAFGEHEFCELNLDAYADLSLAFKQGIDMFNQNEFKQKGSLEE